MIVDVGGIIFSDNSRYLTIEDTYESEAIEHISDELRIKHFWSEGVNDYNDILDVKEFAQEDIKYLLSEIEKLKEENMVLNNEMWLLKEDNNNEKINEEYINPLLLTRKTKY